MVRTKKKTDTQDCAPAESDAESHDMELLGPDDDLDESDTLDEPASDRGDTRQALESQTIRMADEDWQALEQIAKAERMHTGSRTSPSEIARRYIRRGIRQALPPTSKAVVIV